MSSDKDTIKKILYVGNDAEYFAKMKQHFLEKFSNCLYDFQVQPLTSDKSKIKTLLIDIIAHRPDLIYLDFELFPQEIYGLATLLNIEEQTKDLGLIGLLDPNGTKELYLQNLNIGLRINHYKGIEILDPVYHGQITLFPNIKHPVHYAMAQASKIYRVKAFLRLSFIHEKYIHFETNYVFFKGQMLKLVTPLLDSKIASHYYRIYQGDQRNIYSQSAYWYEAQFEHKMSDKLYELLDKEKMALRKLELAPRDKMLKYSLKEIQVEIKEENAKFQKSHIHNEVEIQGWVQDQLEYSRPKFSRVLVIDRELRILGQSEGNLTNLPYSIRCHTACDPEMKIIEHDMPGIIAIQYESTEMAQEKMKNSEHKRGVTHCNNRQMIRMIVEKIHKIQNYNPILIIFNLEETLEFGKKNIGHALTIFNPHDMDIEIISKLALKLEDHLESKASKDFFYINKSSHGGLLEYSHLIKIEIISEAEIYFSSHVYIPQRTTLEVSEPFPFYIYVTEGKNEFQNQRLLEDYKNCKATNFRNEFRYRGLINGLDEIGKQKIRRYVNEFFFEKDPDKKYKGTRYNS
jgi:hypothetical protein